MMKSNFRIDLNREQAEAIMIAVGDNWGRFAAGPERDQYQAESYEYLYELLEVQTGIQSSELPDKAWENDNEELEKE